MMKVMTVSLSIYYNAEANTTDCYLATNSRGCMTCREISLTAAMRAVSKLAAMSEVEYREKKYTDTITCCHWGISKVWW